MKHDDNSIIVVTQGKVIWDNGIEFPCPVRMKLHKTSRIMLEWQYENVLVNGQTIWYNPVGETEIEIDPVIADKVKYRLDRLCENIENPSEVDIYVDPEQADNAGYCCDTWISKRSPTLGWCCSSMCARELYA